MDYEQVARKTEHFTGADMHALLDVAVEDKLRQAMKEGMPRPLTTRDLLNALNQIKPSSKEWFATARNYAIYSNEAGVYDDILKYLNIKL
jgi:SpoVK/Ycf46/Vps4 family AAA+-type ATPase